MNEIKKQKNKVRKKTPVYKKRWFWVLACPIIILMLLTSISNSSKNQKEEIPKQETKTEEKSSIPETIKEKTEEGSKKEEENYYKGGMYKVGADIPPGEYVILGSGYLQISSDSSGTLSSITENDNYRNRAIVSIKGGEYIEFVGKAYTWENAPKIDTSSGVLEEGEYKVGTDFPEGEYKLIPTGTGYYQTQNSAKSKITDIITNDLFSTEKYITLKKGQYISFKRATLKLR